MKSHQKTNARPQKSNSSNSPINATSKSSPLLPGLPRINGWLIRHPVLDIRRRPTDNRPGNKIHQRSIDDQTIKPNQNKRQKKSGAHLSQYAPKAQLQAEEAYSYSFGINLHERYRINSTTRQKVLDLNYGLPLEAIPPEDACRPGMP